MARMVYYRYPSIDPEDLVASQGKDVDLRVLFMALPTPAYSILLFLELCYEVDKTLCGSDTAALSWIKKWHIPHEMGAFKYLVSEELYLWWKTELCELSNEIRNPASNHVSIPFRVRELGGIVTKVDELVDCGRDTNDFDIHNLTARIWGSWLTDPNEPPEGLFKGVFGRWRLLKDSFGVFTEELNQWEQREDSAVPFVPFSPRTNESSGWFPRNDGSVIRITLIISQG